MSPATMEFHVSRNARDRYQFDETLFSFSGNVIFSNFHAARLFAQKMNARRDLVNFPEQAVRAGQINSMGLIDEILHMLVHQYRVQVKPIVMEEALTWLEGMLGKESMDTTLRKFAEQFPPLPVYKQEISLEDYLAGESEGMSHRQILLEELMMLGLANANPAFSVFQELFDDSLLAKETDYTRVMPLLHAFFDSQPPYGPDNQNLIDLLRQPALLFPHSLFAQLDFIRQRWGTVLGSYLYQLLSSMDLIREEEKPIFAMGGPGPAIVYEFGGQELEVDRFSPDKDWMPRLVLIAKNSFVWLDQLSKKYRKPILLLDQIPDEELDDLARWGISGLWLIGLWERSLASKTIKQLRGNPEAVASAYSLLDYQIASDLGGEEAYQNLKDRAWRRGIRLASDMVPNHMGIDSKWLIEHPDWFVSLDYSPFPTYSFNGTNLSWEGRVSIQIEDHYFNNTDAAVVFKRVDTWTGSTQYVYHGNDGTSMPWNDTAQLNYLMPEVREAVIQTILHVARKFPIIRFDAAMTLAKKHYQRLWFPEPGSGGDIPSRAEHGLTKEQFDAAMPVEFWREVVDRVAQELPDTLLLAEAFWMMEGYFVRSLGMHRVYNSAFMNMLRDEKNAEYRQAIKNTLEFDPEILKRYVNFMNNPDERTAVDQFGKGDKYFGVCMLMATLPGLPMFGHGQIEGFTEKYGMEYRKAYWEEPVDNNLVDRHAREIFPVLRRRYIFADVQNFLLFDAYTPEGKVSEDVFAYSNRSGEERTLVIYQNKFANVQAWIRRSAAYAVKKENGEKVLERRDLGEGLGLENVEDTFTIFRDHVTGLEFIRSNRELFERGLYFELDAYKYRVFMNFRQVKDNEWHQYSQLNAYLNGNGVPKIDEAIKEIFLQPIHIPFRELVNAGMMNWVITNRIIPDMTTVAQPELALQEVELKATQLCDEIRKLTQSTLADQEVAREICTKLKALLYLPVLGTSHPKAGSIQYKTALDYLNGKVGDPIPQRFVSGHPAVWGTLLGWIFTHLLGKVAVESDYAELSRSWLDEWLLGKILSGSLRDLGLEENESWRRVGLVKVLITHGNWWTHPPVDAKGLANKRLRELAAVQEWLKDSEVQRFLGVNRYQEALWFNKESFESLLWWMFTLAVIDIRVTMEASQVPEAVCECFAAIQKMRTAEEASGFQIEKMLEALK